MTHCRTASTPLRPAAPPHLGGYSCASVWSFGTLEQQTHVPAPVPVGGKQHVVDALRAAMENFGRLGAPGGYYGQEAARQKTFEDQNKSRLDQAKAYRSEAAQQQQMGQTHDFQTEQINAVHQSVEPFTPEPAQFVHDLSNEVQPPKRRGRPPGVKNKEH